MGWFRDSAFGKWWGMDSTEQQEFQNSATEMQKVYKNKNFTEQVQEQANSRTRNPQSMGSGLHYYPQELFTASQPNGIHFFINARSNSAAAIAAHEADPTALNLAQGAYMAEYTKENRAKAEQYETALSGTAALTAAIGTATAIKSGNILKKGASKFGKVVTTAGGAFVAGVTSKLASENVTTIRLLDSIQLYVPQSIITAYQANWDQAELGMAGLLTTGRTGVGDILSGEMVEAGARGAAGAAANLPKAAGANADFGAAFEATSKKVANPFKEQLFKSIGFRKFSFSYTFSPRNLAEYNMVREIIQKFKYHMHPTVSESDIFLIYPSEFSIQFEHYDERTKQVSVNNHLPKISSCILENVKVVYGPDGVFQTIKNTGGIPSEITMELAFAELETLTANSIEQGL